MVMDRTGDWDGTGWWIWGVRGMSKMSGRERVRREMGLFKVGMVVLDVVWGGWGKKYVVGKIWVSRWRCLEHLIRRRD